MQSLCFHVRTVPWSSVLFGYSIRHDDNHRHSLALSNHVIHDLCQSAHAQPRQFITSCTMQKIQDWITFLGILLVFSRQIHRQTALFHVLIKLRMIPQLLYRTMRNIVIHVVRTRVSTHNKVTQRVVYVAYHIRIQWVRNLLLTTYCKTIGVHLRRERCCPINPCTVFPHHRHRLWKRTFYRYVLHLFVNVTESNRPVTVYKRHTFV